MPVSTDHLRALEEGRRRRSEEIAEARARRITIGRWNVFQADRLNVCLSPGGVDHTEAQFFPNLASAIRGLYSQLLAEHAQEARDVAGLLQALDLTETCILDALKQDRP